MSRFTTESAPITPQLSETQAPSEVTTPEPHLLGKWQFLNGSLKGADTYFLLVYIVETQHSATGYYLATKHSLEQDYINGTWINMPYGKTLEEATKAALAVLQAEVAENNMKRLE